MLQKDMIRIGVWVTPEQKTHLAKLAKGDQRSMSYFIRGYIQGDMDFIQGVEEEVKDELNGKQ